MVNFRCLYLINAINLRIIHTFPFTTCFCIVTRLEKLIGWVNLVKRKYYFPSQMSFHRHVYRVTTVNFSTIPSLFYIIYKTCSTMHLANRNVVWRQEDGGDFVIIILHCSKRIWNSNYELFFNFLHWSYSIGNYYEPITKKLESSTESSRSNALR